MFLSLLIALPSVISLCDRNDKAAQVKWSQKIEQNESVPIRQSVEGVVVSNNRI